MKARNMYNTVKATKGTASPGIGVAASLAIHHLEAGGRVHPRIGRHNVRGGDSPSLQSAHRRLDEPLLMARMEGIDFAFNSRSPCSEPRPWLTSLGTGFVLRDLVWGPSARCPR